MGEEVLQSSLPQHSLFWWACPAPGSCCKQFTTGPNRAHSSIFTHSCKLSALLCASFAYSLSQVTSFLCLYRSNPFFALLCLHTQITFMSWLTRLLIPQSSVSSSCLKTVECLLVFMSEPIHSSSRTAEFITCPIYYMSWRILFNRIFGIWACHYLGIAGQ